MAAQAVFARRPHGRRGSVVDDLIASQIFTAPSSVRIEMELLTLLNGAWQRRRILISKDTLFFSLIGDDIVRDQIPLHEIDVIELMNSSSQDLGMHIFPGRASSNKRKTRRGIRSEMSDRFNSTHDLASASRIVQVRTIPNGFNSGRTYYLQAVKDSDLETIKTELSSYVNAAKKRVDGFSRFQNSQKFTQQLINSFPFQFISSFLIVSNFAMSILEAQFRKEGQQIFDNMDVLLIAAFAFELALSAYAYWFKAFVLNPWCMFDLVVVVLSLMSLAPIGISSRVVLLLRCIRVLRIFGKVDSVKKIFAALFRSVLPMANAFFIIFVVTSIYAIVGVTFYSDDAPESFDTFCRAFISMFCIVTGYVDWWFAPFPSVLDDGTVNVGPWLFLISFVVLVNWVFFQVSIAVLLDNFLEASNIMKEEEMLLEIQKKQSEKRFQNPLDPLLLRLSKDYSTDSDLSTMLAELFQVLDSDGSGGLSSQEFQAAMRKLDFNPRIFVSDSDFVAITKNGALCNADGHIGLKEFEVMMREQLRLYVQSRMSTASVYWRTSDQDFTELGTLKQILLEQLSIKADQERILRFLDPHRVSAPGPAVPPPLSPAPASGLSPSASDLARNRRPQGEVASSDRGAADSFRSAANSTALFDMVRFEDGNPMLPTGSLNNLGTSPAPGSPQVPPPLRSPYLAARPATVRTAAPATERGADRHGHDVEADADVDLTEAETAGATVSAPTVSTDVDVEPEQGPARVGDREDERPSPQAVPDPASRPDEQWTPATSGKASARPRSRQVSVRAPPCPAHIGNAQSAKQTAGAALTAPASAASLAAGDTAATDKGEEATMGIDPGLIEADLDVSCAAEADANLGRGVRRQRRPSPEEIRLLIDAILPALPVRSPDQRPTDVEAGVRLVRVSTCRQQALPRPFEPPPVRAQSYKDGGRLGGGCATLLAAAESGAAAGLLEQSAFGKPNPNPSPQNDCPNSEHGEGKCGSASRPEIGDGADSDGVRELSS